MKVKYKIMLLFMALLSFVGCDGNYKNVTITGAIKSSKEKKPIENAQVSVKCWVYDARLWESQIKEEVVITTDERGIFQVTFKKGEALDLSISADGFNSKEEYVTINRNKLDLTILLDKN